MEPDLPQRRRTGSPEARRRPSRKLQGPGRPHRRKPLVIEVRKTQLRLKGRKLANARDNPSRLCGIRPQRSTSPHNVQVGCFLGVILMPAGVFLDKCVYSDHLAEFLKLRLSLLRVGSAYSGRLWSSRLGHKHSGGNSGVVLALRYGFPPSSFPVMILRHRLVPLSPYYAGLNLVLLAVGRGAALTFCSRASLRRCSAVVLAVRRGGIACTAASSGASPCSIQ